MKSKEFGILVVDDDVEYASTCAMVIERAGYVVAAKSTADEAMQAITSDTTIRLVLTDLRMPGVDGLQLLREIKAHDPGIEVVIMTGYGSIESAIEAIRARAAEYISKPFDKHELLNAISKLYEMWRLQDEVRRLKSVLRERLDIDGFLFPGRKMTEVYRRALAATRCDCTVLITGESGTGKELFAQAIHKSSRRAAGPFIAVNCSTLTGDLMGSELFGHRRGAFTGADRDHEGLFLAADKGTLFLDEIAEMPQEMQVRLLRSLQERAVRPVGSVKEIRIDVRFISATNANVQRALSERRLREDLFHRLNVIPIHLPALRDMPDDIPALVDHFIANANETHTHTVQSVDESAMALLVAYAWPGNIRELENLIARIFSVDLAEVITVRNLPPHIARTKSRVTGGLGPVPELSQAERDLVIRALREAKGNKSKAAKILGISRPRLYKKIKLYDLDNLK